MGALQQGHRAAWRPTPGSWACGRRARTGPSSGRGQWCWPPAASTGTRRWWRSFWAWSRPTSAAWRPTASAATAITLARAVGGGGGDDSGDVRADGAGVAAGGRRRVRQRSRVRDAPRHDRGPGGPAILQRLVLGRPRSRRPSTRPIRTSRSSSSSTSSTTASTGWATRPPGGDYPAGLVTSAPTLRELGDALGVDGEQLEATAVSFNEHAATRRRPRVRPWDGGLHQPLLG